MKTFEEKYTAWIDGKLTAAEAEVFERELESTAFADKANAGRLGRLLREHAQAPALANPDFFNHQIMHRIASESTPSASNGRRWWNWSFPQLVWAGAASLLITLALFKTLIPVESSNRAGQGTLAALGVPGGNYFAEIVDVRTTDPSISATPVYDPKDNVTVLWLDGLDYLPDSYQLQ